MKKPKNISEKSEFYYYPFFERWLQGKGYFTSQSVDIWDNMEIDVLGIKYHKTVPPWVATIEVKMSDWNDVRYQAKMRTNFVDYSYMGLVMDDFNMGYFIYKLSKDLSVLEKHGIGVLIYDRARKRIVQVLSARRQRNIHPSLKKRLLVMLG